MTREELDRAWADLDRRYANLDRKWARWERDMKWLIGALVAVVIGSVVFVVLR